MTQQTPLESLIAMNEQVGKTRKRKARPRDPSKQVERFYRAQLRSLVRVMAKTVKEEILPVVREEKADYMVRDAAIGTMDSWSDRLIAAWRGAMAKYLGSAFESQYERIARRTVSMAEADSTQAFVDSVNKAVGVDLRPMLSEEGMGDYINVAMEQNTQLIKSVPEQYFKRIESAVMGGVRDGDAPSTIARRIQEATGVTDRRARLLARDQSAKLTSEITERRQRQSGIRYYKSVDSGDERVTGRPGGKYPNAKISCWGIARKDVGYGPGVYRWDEGASWGGQTGLHPGRHHINCRCTATPRFDWEIEEGSTSIKSGTATSEAAPASSKERKPSPATQETEVKGKVRPTNQPASKTQPQPTSLPKGSDQIAIHKYNNIPGWEDAYENLHPSSKRAVERRVEMLRERDAEARKEREKTESMSEEERARVALSLISK